MGHSRAKLRYLKAHIGSGAACRPGASNGEMRKSALRSVVRDAFKTPHSLEAKAIRIEVLALSVEFGLNGEANKLMFDYDRLQTQLKVFKDSLP